LTKPRDLVHELWSWERCRGGIRSLKGRLGFPNADMLKFLGLSLNTENGIIHDELQDEGFKGSEVSVYFILCGYAKAKLVPETTRLVSFKQLIGGQAYYKAFAERAIQPLATTFGFKPQMLIDASTLLGGIHQTHGEYSVKIYALPHVPLTIILWAETAEFPASADILFDSNANNYLTTEELAGLAGLTSVRLKQAARVLEAKQQRVRSSKKGSLKKKRWEEFMAWVALTLVFSYVGRLSRLLLPQR